MRIQLFEIDFGVVHVCLGRGGDIGRVLIDPFLVRSDVIFDFCLFTFHEIA